MGARRYSPPSRVTVQETTPERSDDLSKATFHITAHPELNPGFPRPNPLSIPAPLFHSSSKSSLFETQQKTKDCSEMPGGIQETSLAFPTPFFSHLHISQCRHGNQGSPVLSQMQENKDTCGKGRRLLS